MLSVQPAVVLPSNRVVASPAKAGKAMKRAESNVKIFMIMVLRTDDVGLAA